MMLAALLWPFGCVPGVVNASNPFLNDWSNIVFLLNLLVTTVMVKCVMCNAFLGRGGGGGALGIGYEQGMESIKLHCCRQKDRCM